MTGPARQDGAVSLEAALLLPFLAVVTLAVLQLVGVARDQLLVHEAARAGARAAATTLDDRGPIDVATRAAEGRPVSVTLHPGPRAPGGVVTVEVALSDRLGPIPYTVRASAVAEVEPGAGP